MQKFVARQPIFDRAQNIYGYELLFRAALEDSFCRDNSNRATSNVVVDSLFLIGMKTLAGGHRAFLNFTRDFLIKDYATLLPREQAVVEILETVEPDSRVIDACKGLKQRGYLLALDDFVPDDRRKPLVDLADIIKVDFCQTPSVLRRHMVERFAPRGIKLVAEKVETRDQFREANDLGYTYFQGFFFSKPEVLFRRDILPYKLHYLRLLQAIHRSQPDLLEIESIMKQELSLCYKLLRYLNSVEFEFSQGISSIKHALALLGIDEVRKWVSLVVIAGVGEDRPAELVMNSVIRGEFCEILAPHVGLRNRATDLFLMGLLSMMDAILERPLSDILSEVSVSSDVKTALLQGKNRFGYVYELILAYERGDWERTTHLAASLRVNEREVAEAYLRAVEWGQKVFQVTRDLN